MKYLIVGLGNIGDEYADTRHNIGFVVLDALVKDTDVKFSPGRYASIAKIKFKGRTLILIKPATYMNLSGKAVRYWLEKENIPSNKLLVVVDDIALPLGTLRMRKKGGDGGHNGLISIIENINTSDFSRLRIGLGDDFARGYQSEYVLGKWTKSEEKLMIPKVELATEAIKSFTTIGINRTMNKFNKT
ncbi:MAG: aminoacyl-tRNA hydrolase [Bacteroidales bacterium]|nr:aminoacyl-tRNA hydrolase [Bacteroidales bacterium]